MLQVTIQSMEIFLNIVSATTRATLPGQPPLGYPLGTPRDTPRLPIKHFTNIKTISRFGHSAASASSASASYQLPNTRPLASQGKAVVKRPRQQQISKIF